MTANTYVQGAPDSTGKKVETAELTDLAANVVERQVIVHGDPNFIGNRGNVTVDGELWVGGPHLVDLLTAVIVELRVHTVYLQQIANSRDEPDALRSDPSFQP